MIDLLDMNIDAVSVSDIVLLLLPVILMVVEMTFEMAPLCCGLNSKLSFHGLLHYLSAYSMLQFPRSSYVLPP